MPKTKIYLLIVISVLFTCKIRAQTVNEPLYKDVYKFLERLGTKGIIEFDDLILPLSRKYISGKLNEVSGKVNELTTLEKRELEFFKSDYNLEYGNSISPPEFLQKDEFSRFRFFHFADSLLKINLDPVLGVKTFYKNKTINVHRWNGLRFYGYLKSFLGFGFSFRDNKETGNGINRQKIFTPETGIIINNSSENSIEYGQLNVNLGINWKWGSLSLGKDFLEWGYGKSGKIVLSDKAPSFPYVRLDLKLTGWFSFNYIHAKLSSDVIDSIKTYSSKLYERRITRDKYFVSHTLTVKPMKNLTVSLGESMIYSDRFEPVYLIPIIFFKAADHYLSRYDITQGDNGQFFMNVSSRNQLKNTHLWFTLFIDEISFSELFNREKNKNQIGFTFGGEAVDLPIENLTLSLEYTRIYPFVYNNFIQTQTYENHSYLMGHWIGNNADIIYADANYRFFRGFQTNTWFYFIRKGSQGNAKMQYATPQPVFLFGLKKYFIQFGINVKCEILHDLFIEAGYNYDWKKVEEVNNDYAINHFDNFSFSLYYGL